MATKHNHYRDKGFARGKLTWLYAFPPGVSEDIIAVAKWELQKGVLKIVADAQSRCPVRTGKLKESIQAKSNENGTLYWITANAFVKDPKAETGKFYYGQIVEFSPKINKPFLYPAIDANRGQIHANIREAVLKLMNKKYNFMRRAA